MSKLIFLLIFLSTNILIKGQDESIEVLNKASSSKNPCDLLILDDHRNFHSYENAQNHWLQLHKSECRTIFLIYGWLGNKNHPDFMEIIKNYQGLDCHNVIVVEWPTSQDPDYAAAAESVYDVGTYFGEILLQLYDFGITMENWGAEFVGHGLGAHVAALAARTIRDVRPIDSITGLDPAGLLFTDACTAFGDYKLRASDALRVVVLHTNAGVAGTSDPMGKWDFYANGGNLQPSCYFDVHGYCSHHRAIEIFSESILSDQFLSKGTTGHPPAIFGRHMALTTPPGKYYFKTTSKKPWARGLPKTTTEEPSTATETQTFHGHYFNRYN